MSVHGQYIRKAFLLEQRRAGTITHSCVKPLAPLFLYTWLLLRTNVQAPARFSHLGHGRNPHRLGDRFDRDARRIHHDSTRLCPEPGACACLPQWEEGVGTRAKLVVDTQSHVLMGSDLTEGKKEKRPAGSPQSHE